MRTLWVGLVFFVSACAVSASSPKGSCTARYTSGTPNFNVCTQYTGKAFLDAATLAKQQADCTAASTTGVEMTWSLAACATANAFGKCSIDYSATTTDMTVEAVYYNDNLTAANAAKAVCTGTTPQGAKLTWVPVEGTGGGGSGGSGFGGPTPYYCASAAAGVPDDAIFAPEPCADISTMPEVSNSSWTYTQAEVASGSAGTTGWEGANIVITGGWKQAGCKISTVKVTACPTNNLLGVCKDITNNTAVYYYSGWIFTDASAKLMCQSATYTGSGPGSHVSKWYANP